MLVEGGLKPDDMVLQEETTTWRPLAEVTGAVLGPRRVARRRKLVLGVAVALLLLAFSGWTLAAVFRGPNGDEDVQDPGRVTQLPAGEGPTKETNKEAEKEPKRPDSPSKANSPPVVQPKQVSIDGAEKEVIGPDPTPTGGMTETLNVDLQADPTKSWQVAGPVELEAGTIDPWAGRQRPARA